MEQFRIIYVFDLLGPNPYIWKGVWFTVNQSNEEFLVDTFDNLSEHIGIYDVEVRNHD